MSPGEAFDHLYPFISLFVLMPFWGLLFVAVVAIPLAPLAALVWLRCKISRQAVQKIAATQGINARIFHD